MESLSGITDLFLKESGTRISNMGRGRKYGQMELPTRETITRASKAASGSSYWKTGLNTE